MAENYDDIEEVTIQGNKYEILVKETYEEMKKQGNTRDARVKVRATDGGSFNRSVACDLWRKLEQIMRQAPFRFGNPAANSLGRGHVSHDDDGNAITTIKMSDR